MYFKSKFFSYTFRYRLRMFIIEKLTVHTSEDKQKKKVSLSQFSTLPVTLKLVPCMTTTRGQHTALHLLGIDSIKFLTLFLGIVRHSCCNIWRSWSRVWGRGCRWRTRLSSWSHRCSMGFKSGDLEGHGSTLMLFCSR